MSTSARIEKPPGIAIGSLIAPTGICCDGRGELVGQLLGADPAEIAADRRGRGFGELAGISGERRAAAQLLDDPVAHWRATCGRGLGRRREEDFADPIFLRCRAAALSRSMTAFTSSSPTLTNGSILRRCSRCQAISPSIWRLQRRGRGADRAQIGAELLGRLPEVLRRSARNRLSISRWLDLDLLLRSAAWIWSVSSIRLRSTCSRSRSQLLGRDLAAVGDARISARRWSTSVPVMTSPLTIAVALRTLGSLLAEELRGWSGMSRPRRLGGAAASAPPRPPPAAGADQHERRPRKRDRASSFLQ